MKRIRHSLPVAFAPVLMALMLVVFGALGCGDRVPAVTGPQAAFKLICRSDDQSCLEAWNGSDLYGYSDAGSTRTWFLDTSTGNVDIEGTFNSAGTLTAQGIVDVGTYVNLSAQTAISVTAGAIITPTGTYQPLESAGAVTCDTTTCIADGDATGNLLVLRNANASDVITIDGTGGNVECKNDVALGAADTLTLIWTGSDWNCLSTYDNS